MRRFLLLFVLFFCAGSVIFSQTGSATRYVAMLTAVLKESPGFFANDIGSLRLGSEVTALNEEGKWTQVRSGNLTGWTLSTGLSSRKILISGTRGSATELSMAGKGFFPDLEIEYKENGLDYSMVDSMEEIIIPSEELRRFITEGRLARGE
jgi:hypothetical protein